MSTCKDAAFSLQEMLYILHIFTTGYENYFTIGAAGVRGAGIQIGK